MKINIKKKKSRVTMFAMPDIAFLLLIFLILTVSADEYGNINLPAFKYLQETDYPETMVVNISKEGKRGISGDYFNSDVFVTKLNQINKNVIIHLVADEQCLYSDIDNTLDLLQNTGLTEIVLIMDDNTQN